MKILLKNKSKKFLSKLDIIKKSKIFLEKKNYSNQLEYFLETSEDFCLFGNLSETKKWFKEIRKSNQMTIKKIRISQMENWVTNNDNSIYHDTGAFFKIEAIRTHTSIRETKKNYWDQPFITQIGFDGGILGLMRKKFDKIPHYLCEAKFEPGNYKLVQISPTLQATFSNLNKVHLGRYPYFYNFFNNPNKYNSKILFDSWTSEDGGRFLNKRNRSVLIEIPEKIKIKLPNKNFRWLSLYQIKALLKENAWVNPHLRGIIAHT